MKKLALVVGSLLSSFELLAGNFVPVCLNVGDDQKASVYKAIVENSFVTQLDSERAAKLSEEDKNEIINDESGFLKKKIQSVDPSAKVAFIPKSLYQLFWWDFYLNEIVSQMKNCQTDVINLVVVNPVWGAVSEEGQISFGIDDKTPEKIEDFCNNYMNSDNVQSYFWKTNDRISSFEGILEWEISKEEDKKNVVGQLLENISTNVKKVYDSGFFCQHNLMYAILNLSNEFKAMIADLVVREDNAPINTYRIYRGEFKEDYNRSPEISYSFSDGMFGGIVRDFHNGMAFSAFLSKSHMKVIDLPKEKLLNIEEGFDGIERSGLSIHIPPVINMGATLGAGEFHHVRTKIYVDSSEKYDRVERRGRGVAGFGDVSSKGTPWLYSYSSSVTDFWEKLELSNEKTYNLSNKEDLNVKTYRMSSQHLSDLNSFKRFWGSLKEKVGLLLKNIWSVLEPFSAYYQAEIDMKRE